MRSVPTVLAVSGSAFLLAVAALAITEARLGSPLFFVLAGVMCAAYAAAIARLWNEPHAPARILHASLLLALLFRLPLALGPVNPDSDMVRYLWDGRVQRMGLNPYLVVPADPALAYTHTDETRQMPSRRARTPYPPAAQLFFRGAAAVYDSTVTMKLALLAADLITILVIRRMLAMAGRNPWLVLVYAWNPLVVLEIAHSGHIDGLGAMWIAISALALTTRRTLLASAAFVLAVATKLLPIVLVPLFWGRVRLRDVALAAGLAAALLIPFLDGATLPMGALPGVISGVRFNGPVFRFVAALASPSFAAAVAVAAGLILAAWCRWRLPADHPAAWAWPMAAALACAPVIYPWYLLYLTPFLFTPGTLPLLVWTFSVLPAYVVWELALRGARWRVPGVVMLAEYLSVIAAGAWSWRAARRRAG